MPAPQAIAMQELAKSRFRSFAITVPNQPPKMNAPRTFDAAFKEKEKAVTPMAMPPALFLALTKNKFHVETQKQLSDGFTKFIDGTCQALSDAWADWQSKATLTGVTITGPVATGGKVVGPPMEPLIKALAPAGKPAEAKYSFAIAKVIGGAWDAYAASLAVPGAPWYPAFAAVPSPMAPPMPNTPCPVAMLNQQAPLLASSALKDGMIGALGDPSAAFHVSLFDAISFAFEACFQTWQKTTMVTNVLGTGPVPSFAPPASPAGPVVNGTGNMTPGGFV